MANPILGRASRRSSRFVTLLEILIDAMGSLLLVSGRLRSVGRIDNMKPTARKAGHLEAFAAVDWFFVVGPTQLFSIRP